MGTNRISATACIGLFAGGTDNAVDLLLPGVLAGLVLAGDPVHPHPADRVLGGLAFGDLGLFGLGRGISRLLLGPIGLAEPLPFGSGVTVRTSGCYPGRRYLLPVCFMKAIA